MPTGTTNPTTKGNKDMKEMPKALKVETSQENYHGYPEWTTHTLRDAKTNVCIAVVGEVDRYFSEQYADIADAIANAYNSREANEQKIIELTEQLRRVTRAVEMIIENYEAGEFTATVTETGQPANFDHARKTAENARKYFMGIE